MGGRKDIFGFGTSFEAQRWRSLDPSGLICASLSLSAHLYAFAVIVSCLIEGSMLANAIFLLLYFPCFSLALASLYMAWSTDPGSVPMGARPLVSVKRAASGEVRNSDQRAIRRCHKCNDNFKPNRAHHDSVTGRCIVKFDHFCPWVGNSVGALNHKHFCLFVFYTMCSCLVSLLLIALRAITCEGMNKDVNENSDTESGVQEGEATSGGANRLLTNSQLNQVTCTNWADNYNIAILTIISFLFLIFTCTMLSEQYEAIQTNASKIARMKMRVGQAGTELSRVTEEFNEMFGGNSNKVAWHWFLPLKVEFPRGMEKVVLGYEWDETFHPTPYEESHEDEELGKIEMTTSSQRKPDILSSAENDSPKRLTKRSNSKGPDDIVGPQQGIMA